MHTPPSCWFFLSRDNNQYIYVYIILYDFLSCLPGRIPSGLSRIDVFSAAVTPVLRKEFPACFFLFFLFLLFYGDVVRKDGKKMLILSFLLGRYFIGRVGRKKEKKTRTSRSWRVSPAFHWNAAGVKKKYNFFWPSPRWMGQFTEDGRRMAFKLANNRTNTPRQMLLPRRNGLVVKRKVFFQYVECFFFNFYVSLRRVEILLFILLKIF